MERAARGASIAEYFGSLTDPRIDRTKRHTLGDVLTIALCASICGADNWVDIAQFGEAKEEWFKTFLALPNGIPSHDTFGDVFARVDPEEFRRCFAAWVQAVAEVTRGQVLAIDGKTVRRSHDRGAGKEAIHMVNVWATANGLALGQTTVEKKSNEITAIPELLRMLDVSGCIVSIDAMGCQTAIAEQIVASEADYVLAVKQNQGRLYEDIRDLFTGAAALQYVDTPHDVWQAVEKGHGRIERRQCCVIDDPETRTSIRDRHRWVGLTSVVQVTAHRQSGGHRTEETRYYMSSLAADARRLLTAVREHWGVENQLHWVLDVAFREDESRVRKDHGPENLAVLRQMTLNLLKQETTLHRSIHGKRLYAGWREDYLLKILHP